MKSFISTILISMLAFAPFLTQETTGQEKAVDGRMSKAEMADKFSAEERASVASSREQFLLESSENDFNTAGWARDIYRIVDNTHAENSAFFLPDESGKQFVNLFSLLLNLLNTNEIDAFRYDTEATSIEERGKITLPEILDMNQIPFTVRLDNTVSFSRFDLAASDVKSYYIKEKWMYDQRTDKYITIAVAICPVLHHQESYDFMDGAVLKTPLFWVHVDAIAPYLYKAVAPGALSTMSRLGGDISLFDVLRSRLFVGDIYQIGIRNLMKYATSPEELHQQQMEAEVQLKEIAAKLKRANK